MRRRPTLRRVLVIILGLLFVSTITVVFRHTGEADSRVVNGFTGVSFIAMLLLLRCVID